MHDKEACFLFFGGGVVGAGRESISTRLVLCWQVLSCSKNIDDGPIKLAPSEEKIKTWGGGRGPPSLIEA